jgi:hypothetical protein
VTLRPICRPALHSPPFFAHTHSATCIAAANATLSPGEPSTSERPRPQAAADSHMDDAEPRPSRERKATERFKVDANITSRAISCTLSTH